MRYVILTAKLRPWGESHVHHWLVTECASLRRQAHLGESCTCLAHGLSHLPLHLSFYLPSSITWMQYVHGLKIQSAHTSHECLLEVLLHQRPISLFILNECISISELVSQRLNLFVVLCADILELKLHSLFEIFSVLLHLPLPILSFPAEEN